MATITPGSLVTYLPYGLSSGQAVPMATPPTTVGGGGARYIGPALSTATPPVTTGDVKTWNDVPWAVVQSI
jgi:hypothetical protein